MISCGQYLTLVFIMKHKLDLKSKKADEFILAFSSISEQVDSLDLSNNDLYKRTDKTLRKAFEKISSDIKELNLSNNLLGEKCDRYVSESIIETSRLNLVKLFKKLPKTLEKLNLDGNCLWHYSEKELIETFNALPESITTISWRHDKPNWLNAENLDKFMPRHVENVLIHDEELIDLAAQRKAKIVTPTEAHLENLKKKTQDLKERGFIPAYDAAFQLHNEIQIIKNCYANNEIDHQNFEKQSLKAIIKARQELEKHRGWKDILGNIALCILGLAIGYAAVCVYRGRFFEFNTDSVNLLEGLKNTIQPN